MRAVWGFVCGFVLVNSVAVTLCFLLLALVSCTHRVKVAPAHTSPDGTYTYWIDEDGSYVVVAKSQEALKSAEHQISCAPCTVEPIGQLFIVRKVGK